MSLSFSRSKYEPSKKQPRSRRRGELLFDRADGGSTVLRNVSGLLPDLNAITSKKIVIFIITAVRAQVQHRLPSLHWTQLVFILYTVDVTGIVWALRIVTFHTSCRASVTNICRHLQRICGICTETVRCRRLVNTWSDNMTSYSVHVWSSVCTTAMCMPYLERCQ
jgi:hypothetical protein